MGSFCTENSRSRARLAAVAESAGLGSDAAREARRRFRRALVTLLRALGSTVALVAIYYCCRSTAARSVWPSGCWHSDCWRLSDWSPFRSAPSSRQSIRRYAQSEPWRRASRCFCCCLPARISSWADF